MQPQMEASPKDIEKDFNRVCLEINKCILTEDFRKPEDGLFVQLDTEFSKVRQRYERVGDRLNLLHATHNYLLRKSFELLGTDPTKAFDLVVEALSTLLDRHELRRYDTRSFERMLGPYEVALIKINEESESIMFDKVEQRVIDFIDKYFSGDVTSLGKFVSVTYLLVDPILKQFHGGKVDTLEMDRSKFDEVERTIHQINHILDILKIAHCTKKSYLPSLSYEILYRIRKKQLHFLVNYLYFEESEKDKVEAQHAIDQITREMVDHARKSLGYYRSYCRGFPKSKQGDINVRLAATLKELDELNAQYYDEAYSRKDVFKAWKVMDSIRGLCVTRAFNEGVPLSDTLLAYFADEWSLLYVFAKISLLEAEVAKRGQSLSQKWQTEVFSQITESLGGMKGLFKYEASDKRDYTLKIMTSQFAGSFSEYFIHQLCQEFFDCGAVDDRTPSYFVDLLKHIKLARSRDDIVLNDVINQGLPDVDIHIRDQCAVFLKNAKIESDEMKAMWGEVELCRNNGIKNVFYGFNFIKNIQKIEYIRQSFEKMRMSYEDITLEVFDIKDIVSTLIEELNRSGKSKLNFSELDLYKVLDY